MTELTLDLGLWYYVSISIQGITIQLQNGGKPVIWGHRILNYESFN